MRRIIRSVLRHIVGYLFLLPAILVAIALQVLIANPVFKNQTAIPHLIYRACGRIFGVRFSLNPDGEPFSDDKPTMFALNHLSRLDFAALHLFPHAAVMMNARVYQIPVFGAIVRLFTEASGFVATEQTKEGKERDLVRLGEAVADGRNIVIFPEGIQTDGRRVLRYSMGSAEVFYDVDLIARYPALQEAQLQPVVLRVRTIEGEHVIDQPEKWKRYALAQNLTNFVVGMARLSRVGSIDIDVLACPPLDPRDFANAADLINAAHEMTRAIVAPEQTEALTRRQWKERIDAGDFTL